MARRGDASAWRLRPFAGFGASVVFERIVPDA